MAVATKRNISVGGSRALIGFGDQDFSGREFPMFEKDFKFICSTALRETGISLSDAKQEMIYSRIVRRIRALGFENFAQYCHYLDTNLATELGDFTNAITTNLTNFFREPHHFEFLTKTALPELKRSCATTKKIRFWSAGCSTGEEPYSLAMTLKGAGFPTTWDVKILATDLDTNVIAHGRDGLYKGERFDGMDEDLRKRWFLHKKGREEALSHTDTLLVKPALQQMISFKQLNLLQNWPMRGKFNVIFCRNVVIYFGKDTQRTLFERYANLLEPNGFLFIGHSESLHGVTDRFESLGGTIYRKVC